MRCLVHGSEDCGECLDNAGLFIDNRAPVVVEARPPHVESTCRWWPSIETAIALAVLSALIASAMWLVLR